MTIQYPGYTKLDDGRFVANRAVYYPKLSVCKLEKLLTAKTVNLRKAELLKDYKWMLLFDQQTAIEKGFFCQIIADGNNSTYVLKDKFWLVNIDFKITEAGSCPQDLTNNPILSNC